MGSSAEEDGRRAGPSDWQAEYAEIAKLAGGFAHEIRNPLSTISLNIDLLAEEAAAGETPRDRRMLNKLMRVQRECRHLNHVVQAFLQFAGGSRIDPKPTDLSSLIDDFVASFQPRAEGGPIAISQHVVADLPPIPLDANLFRQVLANLFRNACQAMPNGGTIEIAVRADGDAVAVDVIDSGCGMDEANRARMFEAFYSTKTSAAGEAGGSGLGLPTVRKIVTAHGGQIDCDSEPGRGTRFRIRLPIGSDR